MFDKLKEKLKSWFTSSKEKIEKEAKIETLEEPEKADKIIEKAKKKKTKEIPTKFDVGKQKFEPDIEQIKEEVKNLKKEIKEIPQKTPHSVEQAVEENKKTQELAVDIEKQIEKVEELIEKAKEEFHPNPPLKFDLSVKTMIPDVDKIKEETELLHKEISEAKKKEEETRKIEEKILNQGQEISPKKESFFSRITSVFTYKISENEFNEIFDDLEMLLLENNVALEAVESLRGRLAERLINKVIKRDELESEIKNELKNALNELIIEPDNPLEIIKVSPKPFVILFFGINGAGKTTTIAKIAHFLRQSGFSVVLAAGDTFRAASIEQLGEHANRLKIPLIKHDYGADPAAVGFDAVKYAKSHRIDVVLIDTAGRMHTKLNLLEEMKKIERVIKPDLKIFVAESIAGNDATEQAKAFNEAIEIDGTILSKADIDEKGGTVISVSFATNKPIFYLGVGQRYEDLQLFNKQKFIESLGL